jgi:hypothetical protein
MELANKEIRARIKKAGLKMWEVAARYGLNDGNWSRKLRTEFTAGEKEKVISIIEQLKGEQ